MEPTNDTQEQAQREPTPEEIIAHRERIKAYYLEQIKFLKVEKSYQELVTEIEELKMRYVRAQIMMANALAPPPEPTKESEGLTGQTGYTGNAGSSSSTGERKLRRPEHAE